MLPYERLSEQDSPGFHTRAVSSSRMEGEGGERSLTIVVSSTIFVVIAIVVSVFPCCC